MNIFLLISLMEACSMTFSTKKEKLVLIVEFCLLFYVDATHSSRIHWLTESENLSVKYIEFLNKKEISCQNKSCAIKISMAEKNEERMYNWNTVYGMLIAVGADCLLI